MSAERHGVLHSVVVPQWFLLFLSGWCGSQYQHLHCIWQLQLCQFYVVAVSVTRLIGCDSGAMYSTELTVWFRLRLWGVLLSSDHTRVWS